MRQKATALQRLRCEPPAPAPFAPSADDPAGYTFAMARFSVLIVDDEKNIRHALRVCLEALDAAVTEAGSPQTALEAIGRAVFDVVFLDLRLGTQSGLDLIPQLLADNPNVVIIVVTAYATVETAVEAIRRGAWEYLPKPFSPAQIRHLIEKADAQRSLSVRMTNLEDRLSAESPEVDLASSAQVMRATLQVVSRAADSDVSVLFRGESGTGKGVFARAMHLESKRRDRPFVTINCPTLTEELLASELFGHAKGAFTGATSDRVGLFEAANGGTLLLDEIGEVSSGMQAKLLRVLQEHEIRRVGESRNRKVDVRVLAATNRTLSDEVSRGTFRHDLYYRLRVIELRVPALRERQCDILPLTRRFLVEAAARLHRSVEGITPAAADQLVRYEWPGNVRELENAVERAVALALGPRIDSEDLPEEIRRARSEGPSAVSSRRLADVERALVVATLAEVGGNRARAAEFLGIGIATLYRKLKQYGADAEQRVPDAPDARGPGSGGGESAGAGLRAGRAANGSSRAAPGSNAAV